MKLKFDWSFTPTARQLEDLNESRKACGLSPVEEITTAQQWETACSEIDELNETLSFTTRQPRAHDPGRMNLAGR